MTSKARKSRKAAEFRAIRQSQLAAVHGIDVRTLRRWDSDGHPRNKDGTYSAPASIEWRIHRELGADLDLNAERARLAKEQADKLARENAIANGDVAYLPHLMEIWAKFLGAALLALPSHVAGYLEEPARTRAHKAVEERVREILTDLSAADFIEGDDGSVEHGDALESDS